MKYIVHTDGGARGNPGPAAVGVVIEEALSNQPSAISQKINQNKELKAESRKLIAEFGKRIGETTNNVAEYTAVIEALKEVKKENQEKLEIHFFLDSNLVVQQLNGIFKVKDANLRNLFFDVRLLEQEVGLPAGKAGGVITYSYVPREQNKRADYFVNKALDA